MAKLKNNKYNKKIHSMKKSLSNLSVKNPGGGLGRTRPEESCDFTYDGENYAGGPYYDCRDSCANYPVGGEPDWGCNPDADPCDFYVFVSGIWTST